MSWTYSGNPASSALDEVRFLLGDTISTKPYTLSNEEINYAIALYGSPTIGSNLFAAATLSNSILAKLRSTFSSGSKSVGDLSITNNVDTIKIFQDVAKDLWNRANLQGVPTSFGGELYSEQDAANADDDLIQTAAKVDGMSIFKNTNSPADGTR